MKASIVNGQLEIRIPCAKNLQEATVSKSGKSLILASTLGNKPLPCEIGGKVVMVGINAYVQAPAK